MEQRELVAKDGKDPALYELWTANWGGINDGQKFIDNFRGIADNCAEFTEEWYRELHNLDSMPSDLTSHIDWQDVWDCELTHDFTEIRYKNDLYFFYND